VARVAINAFGQLPTILYDGHISLYDSRAGQKTAEASIEFSKEMA